MCATRLWCHSALVLCGPGQSTGHLASHSLGSGWGLEPGRFASPFELNVATVANVVLMWEREGKTLSKN